MANDEDGLNDGFSGGSMGPGVMNRPLEALCTVPRSKTLIATCALWLATNVCFLIPSLYIYALVHDSYQPMHVVVNIITASIA